jgi:acyl-CoA hydrolase
MVTGTRTEIVFWQMTKAMSNGGIYMEPKSAAQSRISTALVILPSHANPAGNMHGGEVMRLMDSTAGVVAQRHSLCDPVTVCVDKMVFRETVKIGNLILCDAELVYTGRTSMVIHVKVRRENLKTGESNKYAMDGYWVMVALDENKKPAPVPPLKIETQEQQKIFDEIRARLILNEEL